MSATSKLAAYGNPTIRSTALAMDARDPLAKYREQFVISDPDTCYLDGNSLGRMPKATVTAVNDFLLSEWGTQLVDGWSHWIDQAQEAGNLLGRAALGAAPSQVLVQDTTSVNFYQACMAAIEARPGRKTVIVDSANFPTDRYIMQGIAQRLGLKLITLDNDSTGGPGAVTVTTQNELITTEVLEPFLNDDVALVTMQVIHYRSGAQPDVRAITDLVRSYGALVVWDASHAIGSIDLQLDQWGVDLAVGCTYKYGNSGPGAPAWLYVCKRLQNQLGVPIQGWFAQDKQFEMGPVFEPTTTEMRRFQIASPSIIGIRMVQTSFAMIAEAGIKNIEAKAQLGTELMIALFDEWLSPLGFTLQTPRDATRRGGHIVIGHPDAKKIAAALRTVKNVVPDFRAPNSVRLGISPLPTSYTEVYDGFARLRDLVESREYLNIQDNGSRVT